MDDLDYRLLSELKINARASVPKLAQILGVARGTVQTRLDKLIATGVIKGFTVKLRDHDQSEGIRAIMHIELGEHHYAQTIASLKKIPGISNLYTTNGAWDLIAEIEAPTMADINRLVTHVRSMTGIRKSDTSLLLGPA